VEIAMRPLLTLGVLATAAVHAGAALAAPSVEIRGAAAQVTIIPEARRNIVVTLTRANPGLPVQIRKLGDHVYVYGDVGRKVHGCRNGQGAVVVAVWGRPAYSLQQLPVLVIRTPMEVRLSAGDAVFGAIARSGSVDFTNRGCGDWTIADVQGLLRLNQAGAGDAHIGSSGSSALSVAGSGGISTGPIRAGLTAVSSGSGDIAVASVSGPVDARVAGPGSIDMAAGSVTTMTVSIAGSGAVTLHGTAQTLQASIAGKGDVSVTKVTGAITKQVFGSGAVRVGR
jgi:hypothetical protein